MNTDLSRSLVSTPSLTRIDPPEQFGQPRAAILMLHGGKAKSTQPVGVRSLSWHRSHAMQRTVAEQAREQGVSVWLAKYAVTGWNAGAPGGPSPIPDARWALDQLRDELGEIPVVLLGHSMGARTAVAVADHPLVTGVVALAPWLPPQESVDALAGKHLVAAHGRSDRITSYAHTEAFVARASRVAASAQMIDMGPLGHYMLKSSGLWNDVAVSHCFDLLGRTSESISD